jgi:hypothetical protein
LDFDPVVGEIGSMWNSENQGVVGSGFEMGMSLQRLG